MSRVPDMNLIEDDGEKICVACEQEVEHLFGVSTEDPVPRANVNLCVSCFQNRNPDYSRLVADFEELLVLLREEQEKYMTEEEMYELYGPEEDEEDEEDEEISEG